MQFSFFGALGSILASSGFASFAEDPRSLIMIIIACVLLYMGIGKKFEPLLLVPIAFGMLLANLPLTGLLNAPVDGSSPGMLWVFYQGVQHAIYPSIIFLGIGAATTSPRSLSGAPITALSATLGWSFSTASICGG